MESRATLRSAPSRPIAVALALLAVLALALTAWFVFGLGAHNAPSLANDRPVVKVQRMPQCGTDAFSPHDAVCPAPRDPYSPHDPLVP